MRVARAAIAGVLLALVAAGAARTESWTPDPLPASPPDAATGYTGYRGGVPGSWPSSYDTDRHPDAESCQLALNAALNAVVGEISHLPAATTQAQHEFANALDREIKANAARLQALRPICLRKPPKGWSIPVRSAVAATVRTPSPLFLPLPLVCPYAECTVKGTALAELLTGGVRTVVGRLPFVLRNEPRRTFRLPLTARAQTVLRTRRSIDVRLTIRSRWAGPTASTTRTVKVVLATP